MSDEKYLVQYKDTKFYINKKLVELKKIDDYTLSKIVTAHVSKLMTIEQMENTNDVPNLKFLAACIEHIEFALQKLWGFPLDKNYHKWYNVPKCICPIIDNEERLGTPYRIISVACPVHGE